MSDFGYRCEHCQGTVRPKRVKREAFKHKTRFVILEDVTIRVCDECANRFHTAETLKRVRHVQTGSVVPAQPSFWDSLIVAAAAHGQCQVLVSEDMQDGQVINGVRFENPFRIPALS